MPLTKQAVADRIYATSDVCKMADVTSADLQYWREKNWLPSQPQRGYWSYAALMKAELMKRLVRVGFRANVASDIADKLRTQGWTGSVDLGYGIVVMQELDTSPLDEFLASL
jgi:hypothetical protein